MNNQKQTFHVHGAYCNSCMIMIESELQDVSHITKVQTSLSNKTVEVTGNFENKTPEEIAEELSIPLLSHGYKISTEKQKEKINWSEFNIAIPITFIFLFLFIVLQKVGLINLVQANEVTYGTSFMIGVIASLSTCMVIVGGLVLSMSATFAKEGDKIKPQLMFHIGRILSFFILGGIIGALGSVFRLTTIMTFILSLCINIVMIILGINLLDVFPWAKKLQPSMPKFIAKHAQAVSKINHTFTPLLVGIATFFLPCGFTQSMQLYTLTTGTFLKGGLTMLAFAIGTLPVLALVSFSSFSIKNNSKSGIFFKTAGLIVLMFAVFNLINSLVIINVLPPLFNF